MRKKKGKLWKENCCDGIGCVSWNNADDGMFFQCIRKTGIWRKPVVTVWAGGSDNVRVQFEKQIQQFNASQDQYTAELQFITSGTGAQGLFERVVAAKKSRSDQYRL